MIIIMIDGGTVGTSSLSFNETGDAKIKEGRHRINVKIEINFFMILCY